MARVEEVIRDALTHDHPLVSKLVEHGFRLGGKRMRPALVLLSGKACGTVGQEHVELASAVELIHTATLIHDDVLDEATLRRHRDTVNARWDNEASVLLGDYVLARAICLASSVDGVFACRTLGQASRLMCEGELRQVVGRGDFDLAEEDYLGIIAGKTASLCACSCRLGAHYAGASDEQEERLSRFGQHLGMAFQITDDLLDLTGNEATTGKSLGTDLAKQKATLPLIRLLSRLEQADRTEVVSLLSSSTNHRLEALEPWLGRSDAMDYARAKASRYVEQATAELDALPATPARDCLRRLAEFVIARRH
ncbi:MAG: polyprenyl synthetase family protein [Pirellulales bacterium]|nr:polyprenyl synthetase family protein [Pirellulales bacterium]